MCDIQKKPTVTLYADNEGTCQQILCIHAVWLEPSLPTYTDTIYIDCKEAPLTLVLLSLDIPCLCKQCRSRSVGFWRSQLIWICSVWYKVFEFVCTPLIKQSDWLKIRSGQGTLIYSASQITRYLGLNPLKVVLSSWLYGASLHRAFHYCPSIVTIVTTWLK